MYVFSSLLQMEDSVGRALGRVTVYSIQGCPHCLQAKATLGRLEVPVCEVDLGRHPELRATVKELTGRSTVPQIFFNSVHVGGNDDLQKLAPEELQRLVRLVREEALPADAPPLPEENQSEDGADDTSGAAEVSLLLREMILKLFSDHLSADGKSVDYKGMSSDPVFERYCDLAIQLQRVELLSLSREEKLAFFINIYNALVIHGALRLGAPTNMWQRYRFFNYVSYLIGGEVFTLQDIENGVLRGNKKGIAQLRKPFSKSDPRLQMALPQPEPLIHFALNCGAKGCPPIKTYTPQDIDSQLRTAAQAFLENDDGCVVDSGNGEVKLSQIFKWYKADFGGTDESLLKWVLEHMSDSPKKTSLQGVLSAGKTKVTFLPYDWSSNGAH
uniref:Zgc:152951 n=1 Tax=Cynoglossus semilaevis TaxID=244447 RepID=A0A3P8W0X4_CYNSE